MSSETDGHSAIVIVDQRLKIKGQEEELRSLYFELERYKLKYDQDSERLTSLSSELDALNELNERYRQALKSIIWDWDNLGPENITSTSIEEGRESLTLR